MENVDDIHLTLNDISQLISRIQSSRLLSIEPYDARISTSRRSGDTGYMLFSSILVFVMTLPGVALFYGGLGPTKLHFIPTGLQILSIIGTITLLWISIGYSLVHGPNNLDDSHFLLGDYSNAWLRDISSQQSSHFNAPSIPESVFCVYHLAFAILAVALIPGSFLQRMKFKVLFIFIALWHLLVYCPIAHTHWHPSGFLAKLGVLDFAGGSVVHLSSGLSALVASTYLSKGKETEEASNGICALIGCGMMWMGWFGLNGGSVGGANGQTGMSMLNTQIAACSGGISWTAIDQLIGKKKPQIVGMIYGIVSGMVAITPAAGYVDTTGAFVIGLSAGCMCFFGCYLKNFFRADDILDVFGIHGVGGMWGGVLTGVFAREEIGGTNGALYGNPMQLVHQLYGILFVTAWSTFITAIILFCLNYLIGLKATVKNNRVGRHGRSSGGASSISLTVSKMQQLISNSIRSSRSTRRSWRAGTKIDNKVDRSGHSEGIPVIDISHNRHDLSLNRLKPSPQQNSPSLQPSESKKNSFSFRVYSARKSQVCVDNASLDYSDAVIKYESKDSDEDKDHMSVIEYLVMDPEERLEERRESSLDFLDVRLHENISTPMSRTSVDHTVKQCVSLPITPIGRIDEADDESI